MLANQPWFLERQVWKTPSGVWQFESPAIFRLQPEAPLGSIWTFDTLGTQAEVTRLYTRELLGQVDSVKTISISNGGLIELSKHHGIIHFESAATSPEGITIISWRNGTERRGLYAPRFEEIYDFQEGDRYEYHEYERFNVQEPLGDYRILQYEVTAVTWQGDTLLIEVEGVQRNVRKYLDTSSMPPQLDSSVVAGPFQQPIRYVRRAEALVNVRLGRAYANVCLLDMNETRISAQRVYGKIEIERFGGGLHLLKTVEHQDRPGSSNAFPYSGQPELWYDTRFVPLGFDSDYTYSSWITGVGVFEYRHSVSYEGSGGQEEHQKEQRLVACHTEDFQYGTFTDPALIVSTEPRRHIPAQPLRVSPNPVNDRLGVLCEIPGRHTLHLTDLQGRTLETWILDRAHRTLDTGTWPPGIYLLELRTESGLTFVQKVVRAR